VDTDQSKQKFSVKTLYEQTLIPQIMAFWISEDTSLEAKLQLIEVVMGMWCSIYTLGLHSHASVKDVSSTLTLTLVSVLKLSPINERLELIAKSFTKHCTNAHFCVSGLLKFLTQFLLDEDLQVREAAARAIATVAHQAAALVTSSDATAEQRNEPTDSNLDVDGASSTSTTPSVSSPSSTSSAHVSRIRQYCEKQQTLLPARRPIFSRSTFASERSLTSLSVRGLNGLDSKGINGSATDLLSSRRSSMVSQDSFMFSEQGSLKSTLTPTLTRTGSFSTEHVSQNSTSTGLESRNRGITADRGLPLDNRSQSEQVDQVPEIKESELDAWDDTEEQDMEATAQLELQKALELAKAEMKMRQLPVDSSAAIKSVSGSAASLSSKTHGLKTKAAFGWDASNDDDNWDSDDATAMDGKSSQR